MNGYLIRKGPQFLLSVVVLLGARPVLAQAAGNEVAVSPEQREEARVYFEEGSKYYQEGDFETAISEFQRAFAIVRSPEILYNIARCHEELKHTKDAIYNYEMYIRLYPTASDAEEVQHRINVLNEVNDKEEKEKAARAAAAATSENGDAEPASGSDNQDEPKEWYTGLRLAGHAGAVVPVMGPWERVLMPAYLVLHIPMADWFHLTLAGTLGIGAQKDDPGKTEEVNGTVGAFVGCRFIGAVSKRFELFLRAGLAFFGLAREHLSRMTLMVGGQVAPGFTVHVTPEWRFVVEAVTDIGVIFPGLLNDSDGWEEDGKSVLTLVTGGLVGMEYEF